MKALLIALFVVALVATAQPADKGVADWQNLRQLRAGQRIEVVQTSMAKQSGKFVSVSEGTITLLVNQTEHTIQREQVARVSSVSHRVRNGVLIGIGGMAAAALTALAASGCWDGGCPGAVNAAPALGLAGGVMIGVATGAPHVYYRRP